MSDDPTAPVADACLWCKVAPENAAPNVSFVDVGDEERLCTNCREQLRAFKRTAEYQLVVSDEFAAHQFVTEAMAEAVDDIADALQAEGGAAVDVEPMPAEDIETVNAETAPPED